MKRVIYSLSVLFFLFSFDAFSGSFICKETFRHVTDDDDGKKIISMISDFMYFRFDESKLSILLSEKKEQALSYHRPRMPLKTGKKENENTVEASIVLRHDHRESQFEKGVPFYMVSFMGKNGVRDLFFDDDGYDIVSVDVSREILEGKPGSLSFMIILTPLRIFMDVIYKQDFFCTPETFDAYVKIVDALTL